MENKSKDQFYFHGKFFDSAVEGIKYAKEWADFELDQETFDRLFDRLKKDILLNILLHIRKFKNKEIINLMDETFEFFIKRLNKYDTHQ